jgi:hypothetical protein
MAHAWASAQWVLVAARYRGGHCQGNSYRTVPRALSLLGMKEQKANGDEERE